MNINKININQSDSTYYIESDIYDVSAHNNGATFESLSAILSSDNLSTLIPTAVRCGGMSIRFIQGSEQSSDNKYVQYRLMATSFSTNEADWSEVVDGTVTTEKLADRAVTVDKINFQQVTYPMDGLTYNNDYISNKWYVYLTPTSGYQSSAKGMLVLRGIIKDVCIVKAMFFYNESYRNIIVLDANFEVLGAYNTTSDEFTSYYQDGILTIDWNYIISLHADAIFIALCLTANIVNISSVRGNQWATSISLYDKKVAHISTELIKKGAVDTDKLADNSITSTKIQNKSITQEKLDDSVVLQKTTLTEGIYASVGDSITEGVGITRNLDDSDEYKPLSGAAKPTYAYYIAKLNNMKWYNYGISGSTMGDIVANGSDKRGFSKMNGRYTQMADDLTHISIFFGINDSFYGPLMKREDWLLEQYGTKIYYPRQTSLIGTVADDGTPFATQEQYDACNSVTGTIDGVQYNSSAEYFNALYCGNIDSIDNKTWYGAWNTVLPYLIEKYPMAKILCIVPFNTTKDIREAVRQVAKKYGLPTYEFNSSHQLFYQWDEEKPSGKIGDLTVYKFRQNNLTLDGLHPTEAGYKYLYPSINARLAEL